MKKKEYIVPETKVYPMEEELFLCTSVQPQESSIYKNPKKGEEHELMG